jgi:hypothetical protein
VSVSEWLSRVFAGEQPGLLCERIGHGAGRVTDPDEQFAIVVDNVVWVKRRMRLTGRA